MPVAKRERAAQCFARRAAYAPASGLLMSLLLLAPLACRPASPVSPPLLSDQVSRGPVSLTVSAMPTEPWVGDVVRIELRARVPKDHDAAFDALKFPDELRATVVAPADARPQLEGDLEWRQSLTIEPVASGELEIPPVVLRYGPRGAALDLELVTNPLKLKVRSALTTQDSMMQPRDISATLLPAAAPLPWWQRLAIAGGVLASAALLYGVYRVLRARAARPPPPLTPEAWALQALDGLRVREWFEQGRISPLYYRLSEVVREYIERKFALAAPEMTTEEFLAALARDRGALPYDASKLSEFMTACDIVKYAAYPARVEDAEQAVARARAFVQATASARRGSAEALGDAA